MNYLTTPPPALQRYCIGITPELAVECLQDWEWLLPHPGYMHPALMTKLGDWFLVDKNSKLHFLSLLEGNLTPLDATLGELESEGFLEKHHDLLSVDWVEICLDQGRDLPEGMCYGWSVHPILGAPFHSSNLQFFTIRVCQSLHAQLHEQLQARAADEEVFSE